jgi:hypothetical protein
VCGQRETRPGLRTRGDETGRSDKGRRDRVCGQGETRPNVRTRGDETGCADKGRRDRACGQGETRPGVRTRGDQTGCADKGRRDRVCGQGETRRDVRRRAEREPYLLRYSVASTHSTPHKPYQAHRLKTVMFILAITKEQTTAWELQDVPERHVPGGGLLHLYNDVDSDWSQDSFAMEITTTTDYSH